MNGLAQNRFNKFSVLGKLTEDPQPVSLGSSADLSSHCRQWAKFAKQCKILRGAKVIPFEPTASQIQLFLDVENRSCSTVKKESNAGVSTVLLNMLLWKAHTEEGFAAIVYCPSVKTAKATVSAITLMARGSVRLGMVKTQRIQVCSKNGGKSNIYIRKPMIVRKGSSVSPFSGAAVAHSLKAFPRLDFVLIQKLGCIPADEAEGVVTAFKDCKAFTDKSKLITIETAPVRQAALRKAACRTGAVSIP